MGGGAEAAPGVPTKAYRGGQVSGASDFAGRAYQSSTLGEGRDADRGPDGDPATFSQTGPGRGEFWQLELDPVRQVSRVVLWNREGTCIEGPCAARLYRARLEAFEGERLVYSTVLFKGMSDSAIATEPHVEIQFHATRIDRIRLVSTTGRPVQLSEVHVFGAEQP